MLAPASGVPFTASCAARLYRLDVRNAFGRRGVAFVGDDHPRGFPVGRQEQLQPAS